MQLKREKIVTEARERYKLAREVWGPIYDQMRSDLRFSDPTCLEQWPEQVKREREREGRPCLTFDQTSQYVRQIINQARRNKPALKFIPVDDQSDPELADILQGLARQVEYESKAEPCYITALDHAVRGGVGFFLLVTEELQGAEVVGQQCARIKRVVDPTTVLPDPDFLELDGSDMRYGFVEETLSRDEFKSRWPKAAMVDFDSDGWFGTEHVRVCQYFRIVETTKNSIAAGGKYYSEEEYWSAYQENPEIGRGVPKASAVRRVDWFKLSGEGVLEESEFPAEYVPIFPVIGNESWDKGKRRMSGLVRGVRDPQIAYNFERNGEIEAVAIGPKAPWVGPAEAIEGHEGKWQNANRGTISYLPYNSVDEAGQPIERPQRTEPAGISAGWATLADRSKADIQAGMGMFNASVGNNPNNQSGRAVLALQDKADIGSFHYVDNLALSISHLGLVLTQVWPRIYDNSQVVRILGEDDDSKFVRVDPQAPRGYQEMQGQNGQKMIVINIGAGKYDARAVVGPAYSTRQTEAAAEISELVNGNPQMLGLLGDIWVKMRGFPDSDKIAKRFHAMLPPQALAAEQEEEGGKQLDPAVQQTLMMAKQEIEQLHEALGQAQQELQHKTQAEAMKLQSAQMIEQIRAQTAVQVAEIGSDSRRDVEELKGMVSLLLQHMQPPPQLAAEVSGDMAE